MRYTRFARSVYFVETRSVVLALNLKWVKYWPARAGVDDASINFIFVICQLQRGSSAAAQARARSHLSPQHSARAESESSLARVSREFSAQRKPMLRCGFLIALKLVETCSSNCKSCFKRALSSCSFFTFPTLYTPNENMIWDFPFEMSLVDFHSGQFFLADIWSGQKVWLWGGFSNYKYVTESRIRSEKIRRKRICFKKVWNY